MKGIVLKSVGNLYLVEYESGIARCILKGNFKIKGIRSTNPVAVGDRVVFEFQKNTDTGLITNIEERKNYILRKSTNLSKQTHIIAANIDLAVLMITIIKPVTYTQFIDRFLTACEAFHIDVLPVLNKMDLLNEEQNQRAQELKAIYEGAGYPFLSISVKAHINIEAFKTFIDGKTIVISGNSGVGKSSLINILDADKNLKIADISDAHEQGKHTTTFAEMHKIGNGYIIDTPGIKGFGTIGIEKEQLGSYFPEIRALQKACKFSNCTHIHEPGCAVKKAVENSEINPGRYKNYLSIYFDDDTKYRQEEYL